MGNNITIKQAAEIMGKCQQFVRVGLQRKLLPFGTAVKVHNRFNYYISPKLFYEYVGSPDDLGKEIDYRISESKILETPKCALSRKLPHCNHHVQ